LSNSINFSSDLSAIQMSVYEAPTPKESDHLTLLFIHGLESSKETWLPVIPKLQDHYKIYAIDLRGHGESPSGDNPGELSIWHFVADIERFVQEKGLKDFVLVTHSMGARIGIAYASCFPHNLRRLVIEDMEIKPRDPVILQAEEIEFLKAFNPLHPSLEEVENELKRYGYTKEKYQSLLKQGRIKWLEGKNQYYIGINPYIKFIAQNACSASNIAEESFKTLAEKKVQVLLMKAEFESSVSEKGLKEMQKLLPSMEVIDIPESSHSIHKTQTNLFIKTLNSYLEESEQITTI
jgi:pimeloyl-ACP methyl ester carboxylesterase